MFQTNFTLVCTFKKDLSDLEFVCNLGIEWLGLSFVQRAKDIKEAKKIVRGRAAILSKIENLQQLMHLMRF